MRSCGASEPAYPCRARRSGAEPGDHGASWAKPVPAGDLALSPVGSRRVRPRIGHTGDLHERGTAKCPSATIRVQSLHRLPACRSWRPRVSPLVTRTTSPTTPGTSSTRSWSTLRPSRCSCPRFRRRPSPGPRVRCCRRLPRRPTSTSTSTTNRSRRLRGPPSRRRQPLNRPPNRQRPRRRRLQPLPRPRLAHPGFAPQHPPRGLWRPRRPLHAHPGSISTSPHCRRPRCSVALPRARGKRTAATPAPAACPRVIRRRRPPRPSHWTWIPR